MVVKRVWLMLILSLSLFSWSCGTGLAGNQHQYILWSGLEPDKCGVVWLVKRFVDPEAVFKILPKGSMAQGGIHLDTPYAQIKRGLNQAAFEVALQKYQLKNPTLKRIGRILWDIEVNKWAKKITNESAGLAVMIHGLAQLADQEKALEKSLVIFDALYAGLQGSTQ